MKGRLRAAGSLSKSVPSTTTTTAITPIWITDELLADTYRRFARQPLHKRHGSSVPGPLEARRRASKRRNTSWAQGPSAPPPVEPAILFGKHSPAAWWQDDRRKSPKASSEPSLLPSWLLPTAPPPEQPPKRSILPSWLHPTALPIPKQATSPIALFPSLETLSELSPSLKPSTTELWKRCKNVQDIHVTVLEEGINLQQNPYITATIFREASISQWPVQEIAQFLTDPSLNPPRVRHCSRLLSRVREFQRWKRAPPSERNHRTMRSDLPDHLLFPENWSTLHAAFCRAASLGLIDSLRLQQMIDMLLALESKELELKTIHRNIYELVTSFEQSRVCRIQDLDHAWTAKLVSKLLSRQLSASTIKLLLIFRNEQHMECILVSSLKAVFISSTSHILSNTHRQPGLDFRDQAPTANQVSEAFLAGLGARNILNVKTILRTIPLSIFAQALATVTLDFHSAIRSGHTDPQTMPRWGDFIESLQVLGLSPWLLDKSNFIKLRKCITNAVGETEGFHLAIWIVLKVCQPSNPVSGISFSDISEQLGLDEDFPIHMPLAVGTAYDNALPCIRFAVQHLPFEGTFAKQLHLLTKGLWLRAREAELEIPTLIPHDLPASASAKADNVSPSSVVLQPVLDLSFLHLMNDQWYGDLKRTSPDTLTVQANSVRNDLPKFMHLARRIVHGDKLAIRVVKRLLEHNLSLKVGLAQSWPQRVEYLERFHHSSHQPGGTSLIKRNNEAPGSDPTEALKLIERLALSFALTPRLTNRTALLQVRWCYLFLLKHGAPITPAISHALWQAGVVRYRGLGPGPTQLKWLLKIVVQVEGKGVARMLLWNSQFRRDREAWLKLVDSDDDGQAADATQASVSKLGYHPPPKAPYLDLSLTNDKEGPMTATEQATSDLRP